MFLISRPKVHYAQRVHAYIKSGATQSWVVVVGYLEYPLVIATLTFVFDWHALVGTKRRFDLVWLFTVYLAYFSLITGHDGCARFRMLFEFVLILLAALGIWALTTKVQERLASSGEKS
jgi:hypothetical protein